MDEAPPWDRWEVAESEAALQREGFGAVGELPFGVQEPPAVAGLDAVGGTHFGWNWGGPGGGWHGVLERWGGRRGLTWST